MTNDTIFALASGAGVAGIAVIRVSGPGAARSLAALTRKPLPAPRRGSLRRLYDAGGALLDEALVLRFAEGSSYTGEALVELHCHGGRAVVQAVMAYLAARPGHRLAEPGEFTRRAVEAGRMDLAEVEALGDLLQAETALQHRRAAEGLGGALHREAERWRQDLLRAAALIEVTMDWADEDVPEDVSPEVAELISGVELALRQQLATAAGAERLRSGFEVAIMGPPNVGKSSLLNMLAGREAAITSEISGTTRDVIELRYDLDGLPVTFLDTAGLRETQDPIERLGIERATARGAAADLRLFLVSADCTASSGAELAQTEDLRVWSKADLAEGPGDVAISAVDGSGLERLLAMIGERLTGRLSEAALVGHLRQRQAVEEAVVALDRARGCLDSRAPETAALELRAAMTALERMLGRIDIEDILGQIFASFCLGK